MNKFRYETVHSLLLQFVHIKGNRPRVSLILMKRHICVRQEVTGRGF